MPRRKTHKKRFKQPTASDMFLDYVASENTKLVEEYLDGNGDVKVRNCKGETALHVAAAHHQNKLLESLLPYFNEDELDMRDMYGLPAYMTAIKYGNDSGARIISEYRKSIGTKPYRFKNYKFNNNNNDNNNNNNNINLENDPIEIDNLIVNGNKITSKINKKSLNNFTKELLKVTHNNTRKNKVKKELKRLEWTMKNIPSRPFEDILKIQNYNNLPNILKTTGAPKNRNTGPGYNNTQLKQLIINNKSKKKTKSKLGTIRKL